MEGVGGGGVTCGSGDQEACIPLGKSLSQKRFGNFSRAVIFNLFPPTAHTNELRKFAAPPKMYFLLI